MSFFSASSLLTSTAHLFPSSAKSVLKVEKHPSDTLIHPSKPEKESSSNPNFIPSNDPSHSANHAPHPGKSHPDSGIYSKPSNQARPKCTPNPINLSQLPAYPSDSRRPSADAAPFPKFSSKQANLISTQSKPFQIPPNPPKTQFKPNKQGKSLLPPSNSSCVIISKQARVTKLQPNSKLTFCFSL